MADVSARIRLLVEAQGTNQATGDVEKLNRGVGDVGKTATRTGGALKRAAGTIKELGKAMGAGGVLAGAAALHKGITDALDIGAANTKLTAQLGLTAKESKRYGALAGDLFANNYGDSLEQVNEAIRGVALNVDGMRGASSKSLSAVAGDVLNLASTFDQDLGGTTRAVGKLMRTGLARDARDALNIVTRGFQTGADQAGDYLDTLNEYGTQFRKLGIDGKTATGLISQGLKAGARDGDLVADAFKEFSIRAVDGSTTTSQGFKALGLDADAMAKRIADGGPKAARGLDNVLDRLRGMHDPVKRSQAAVKLFGTQAEDLGDALYNLDPSKATKDLGKVGGAAKRMGDTLSGSTASKIETFKRKSLKGLSDFAAKYAIPAIDGLMDNLGPATDKAKGYIKGLLGSDQAGQGFAWVKQAGRDVASFVTGLARSTGLGRGDLKRLIEVARRAGRMIVDRFQSAKKTLQAVWPGIRQVLRGIATIIGGVVRTVSSLLSGDWAGAWSGAKQIVRGAWEAIKGIIRTAIAGIIDRLGKLKDSIGSKVSGAFDGLKDAFRGAINFIIDGWNGLELKMPTVNTHIPGVGKVGGFTIGTPDIPRLAKGGVVRGVGSRWISGEAGPELGEVVRGGVRVTPITMTAPRFETATVRSPERAPERREPLVASSSGSPRQLEELARRIDKLADRIEDQRVVLVDKDVHEANRRVELRRGANRA